MKVGDYVRTRWGCIAKFEGIHEGFYEFDNIIMDESSAVREELFVNIVEKTSPNIIDLIEVGDFINKQCIVEIKDNTFYTSGGYFLAFEDFNDIVETIVTKEQFKEMEYKVND